MNKEEEQVITLALKAIIKAERALVEDNDKEPLHVLTDLISARYNLNRILVKHVEQEQN